MGCSRALAAAAWVAVLVSGKRDITEKKKKKYAEDTGFDWSETSDGCVLPGGGAHAQTRPAASRV